MDVLEPSRCMTLNSFNWIYRGEGNAHLVISLPNDKLILRMSKTEYSSVINRTIVIEHEQKLIRDVKFNKEIMVPLFGLSFIQPPILARISEEDVVEIDRKLFTIRPKFRLNKGIGYTLATAHPDYTYLPLNLSYHNLISGLNDTSNLRPQNQNDSTFCIEIKPKQGWTHPSDRHSLCTYCMNQYLKYKKKRVNRISLYCPLDLFSGNSYRMKKSLKNLLKTPQNNLKIFEDGNLKYSEDCNGDYFEILKKFIEPGNEDIDYERVVDKWTHLMYEALTKESEEIYYGSNDTDEVLQTTQSAKTYCDWKYETLPDNCVLQRLLKIQKLQKTDFNTIYNSYKEKYLVEKEYDYVDKLLNGEKLMDPIQRYLLGATAKDCSIFFTFKRCGNKSNDNINEITGFDGIKYSVNIGVSDTDPKPLSCIEKHYKRDKELVTSVLPFF